MMLFACSGKAVIKTTKTEQIDFPIIDEINYMEFSGTTYRDLVEYTLNLQSDLKQCISNINIIKEWYNND